MNQDIFLIMKGMHIKEIWHIIKEQYGYGYWDYMQIH